MGTGLKTVNNYFGNVIGEFLDPLLESLFGSFLDPLLGSLWIRYWGVIWELLAIFWGEVFWGVWGGRGWLMGDFEIM